MVTISKVQPEQVPTLARMLARAFDRDPFYDFIIPRGAERAERLVAMFQLLLREYSVELSHTYTTPALDACALWKPPGDYRLSFFQQLRAMPGFARVIGWSRIPRGLQLMERIDALHARLAPAPHMYLNVLGVEPERQRGGLGSALLRHVLSACDRDRRDAYLETTNAKNVPFYEHHGFVLRHTTDDAKLPTFWCMSRSPR